MIFSIICTNYNKEPYIEACIKSVISQTWQDFEFIIVDDCSNDNSPSIIEKYSNKYPDKIKYIKNEQNVGMAANYNLALNVANGEYLALIDSDDIWFPTKLEEVMQFFKSNPNCVMHQHPLQVYEHNEPTAQIYRPYLLVGDIAQYIKKNQKIPLFVATTGLSFRMNVVKKVLPIPVSFCKNGEAFLTRTVICYGDVGATFKTLGGYRFTGTNIVFGNENWDSADFIENTLKPELNKFYKENKISINFSDSIRRNKKIWDYSLRDIFIKLGSTINYFNGFKNT